MAKAVKKGVDSVDGVEAVLYQVGYEADQSAGLSDLTTSAQNTSTRPGG